MPTDCLFREDSYLEQCDATVVGLTEAGGVVLDRTVFYAASGGQPADRGVLTTATGDVVAIASAGYIDAGKTEIAHLLAAASGPQLKIGEPVRAAIDRNLRYARMRMHTALHLLSAVLPYPVTGGAIGDGEGRLDFLDKDDITGKLAEGWSLTRLDKAMRAILRAGTYELMARADVPAPSVVNEYVDVADAFFDAKEKGFVNGLLDAIAKDVRR